MKNINKYFLGIVLFMLVTIISTGIIGHKQDTKNKEEFLIYNQILIDIEEGKNLDKSLEILNSMQKNNKDNYIFNINKAAIYIKQEKFEEAKIEYGKAVKNNKKLINNVKFLTEYAQISLDSGDNEVAKELITKVKEIGISPDIEEKVNSILVKVG